MTDLTRRQVISMITERLRKMDEETVASIFNQSFARRHELLVPFEDGSNAFELTQLQLNEDA